MIVHDVVQGTPEWLRLRAGIPTASEFDKILTPGGKRSKSAEPYRFRLLAERCMGHPVAEFVSLWMARGSDMEIDAVRFYEFQTDTETIPVGFVTDDAGRRGASPDRFVGERGNLEIKVPSEQMHMSYLLTTGGAYDAYKVQVQGQILVTLRDWTDVLSYHPELPPAIIRIERDEPYIKLLDEAVEEFCDELERLWATVQERGWVKSQEDRTVEQLQDSLNQLPPLAPLDELVKMAKDALRR